MTSSTPEPATEAQSADVLPAWEQMTDRDKHEALWHVWKRENEGKDYAVENYPAMYRDHPALVGLDEDDACDHAKQVVGTIEAAATRLGKDEYERLIDIDPDVEGDNSAAPDAGQQLVDVVMAAFPGLTTRRAQDVIGALLRKLAEIMEDEDTDEGWPDADDLLILANGMEAV